MEIRYCSILTYILIVMNKVLYMLILFLFCFCTNRENERQIIKKYYGKRLDMTWTNEQLYHDTINNEKDVSFEGKKIIVHLDEKQCQQCIANTLSMVKEYNQLLQLKNISATIICIVPLKMQDILNINEEIEGLSDIVIVSDADNLFLKRNKIERYTNKFHSFLLDDFNRVLLVGDPIHYENIRNLYNKMLVSK